MLSRVSSMEHGAGRCVQLQRSTRGFLLVPTTLSIDGASLTRASKQELARFIPGDCVHASAVAFEGWKLLLHPFDKAFHVQKLVT